jgi:hypothetical protein
MRAGILKLMGEDCAHMSNTTFFGITLSSFGFLLFIALILQVYFSSVKSLSIVISFTGGVAGSFLYFVAPSLCALKVLKKEEHWKAWTLLFFGAVIMLSVTISTFL